MNALQDLARRGDGPQATPPWRVGGGCGCVRLAVALLCLKDLLWRNDAVAIVHLDFERSGP